MGVLPFGRFGMRNLPLQTRGYFCFGLRSKWGVRWRDVWLTADRSTQARKTKRDHATDRPPPSLVTTTASLFLIRPHTHTAPIQRSGGFEIPCSPILQTPPAQRSGGFEVPIQQ
ncbi:hypothetical protein RISK_000315 [Rhodopirellula islandica]|uniref:Uncharacterized protein n=1 Tax=Rhodopirellula islandica TaxID=595434 RepID=A0A0J1BMG3_RHOIS|nr:hypothetical protein RISK_000315 [Rhodopirellula islandica]